MDLTGYRTTFTEMFSEHDNGVPQVDKIEIPLIQRDYAQGREDARSNAIRAAFLDTLHHALTTNTSVGLDFIYGDVRDGNFEPLDGQQRLTTLFLLHWYIATRRGALDEVDRWTNFTYATRPSARLFCERIVKNPAPSDLATSPSEWVIDQSWYLHLWRFDPTIHAMLVTLDAIAERFKNDDADGIWERLTTSSEPAIWFQLLPIEEMGAPEELYIKMNSRGKPLTEFEAFKARLGEIVAEVNGPSDFGHKIDGIWTDLFWPYRGDNEIVDDEFMRYFDFLIEVCEWRDGHVRKLTSPTERISELLSSNNPNHEQHLTFICDAFDAWVGDVSIADFFDSVFKTSLDGDGVLLFGAKSTNLFRTCCDTYGSFRGPTRAFSLTDTLLLFAVLTHKISGTEDVSTRLRVLRNINEASEFEMRVQNMPHFIREVAEFMKSGELSCLETFNRNQVADEVSKRDFRAHSPEATASLTLLEDHNILRGTLAVFDLDSSLDRRAAAFETIFGSDHWPSLTGALLATGEYQRDYPNSDQHRLGSPTTASVWRLLLVDRGDRDALERVRTILSNLLDRVAAEGGDAEATLAAVSDEFVRDHIARSYYDWRYYLVNYRMMREGNSGIYYGADGELGYELTMLRKTVQRSWYRDAYLYGMWVTAGSPAEVKDSWFYGYSTTPRWMKFVRSGIGLRNIPPGIAIQSESPEARQILDGIAGDTGIVTDGHGWLLPISKGEGDDLIDSVDRVQAGAKLVAALIDAGL